MAGTMIDLKKEFDITAVDALHYFEYKSDFIFQSDYHDDWRLLFVEKGACEIFFSGTRAVPLMLQEGELFIEAPHESYSFKAAAGSIPLVFTAGFLCESPNMYLLSERILRCNPAGSQYLSLLIQEGQLNFSTRINETGQYTLDRKYNRLIGGEQLTGIYLEMLLISLMRQHSAVSRLSYDTKEKSDPTSLSRSDSVLLNRITDYYASHIMNGVTIEEICREFDIGRSHLQRIFREQTGCSAIDYFCRMRISTAKQLIQENRMNLTDIAKALGYTSLQYFSRQFKKITGIPPSEYQDSIRLAVKNPIYQHIDLDQYPVTAKDSADTTAYPS